MSETLGFDGIIWASDQTQHLPEITGVCDKIRPDQFELGVYVQFAPGTNFAKSVALGQAQKLLTNTNNRGQVFDQRKAAWAQAMKSHQISY